MTAYQSASGVMNLVVPTSAVVMGGLAIARVPYGTYLRWVWPLLALLSALSVIVLVSEPPCDLPAASMEERIRCVEPLNGC